MERFKGEPLRHMGDLPSMAAQRYGDKKAFDFLGQETSFEEFEANANSVANILVNNGVSPGDRVALYIPNTDQFPEAYFGAHKAGAIPVPLNLQLGPDTLEYVIQDAAAEHMIASPMLLGGLETDTGVTVMDPKELAERVGLSRLYVSSGGRENVVDYSKAVKQASDHFDTVEREFDDVACQPYTSGTTGKPKGVLLTHENLLSTIETYSKDGFPIDADDSIVLVLPFFHLYALNGLMGTYLYNGASMYIQPEADAETIMKSIGGNDVTSFAGVPALFTEMWRIYREDPDQFDLSPLDFLVTGAGHLADDTRRTIVDEWDVPMIEGWGMTETGPTGTFEPVRGVQKSAGCVGPVSLDVELKLVDPETRETRISMDDVEPVPDSDIDFEDEESVTGEIAIRGPNVFEGYHDRPEKNDAVFDEEGWFYTEDIGRVDEDGYFWMVDRADDMIIAGGENVYPAEVEEVLYGHPAVAEAGVVGAPHEVKGEAPVAFVMLEDDGDATEEEIRRFALENGPSYAHPRRVFFVDELPVSGTGKVQRFKLEEEVNARIDGPIESSEKL